MDEFDYPGSWLITYNPRKYRCQSLKIGMGFGVGRTRVPVMDDDDDGGDEKVISNYANIHFVSFKRSIYVNTIQKIAIIS